MGRRLQESNYIIEWMRYEFECNLPEIVKTIPQVAFEVENLEESIQGKNVMIAPNSPLERVRAALIEGNGAWIEFIQVNNTQDK